MKETTFLEEMFPKMGPSAIQNLNTAQLIAIRELLIKKGIFTREEMTNETEIQLDKISQSFANMPIPSPIQPKK